MTIVVCVNICFILFLVFLVIEILIKGTYLELGEFISSQLLPRQYETHHVLRQQGEWPQVQDIVAVLVDEFQHLEVQAQRFSKLRRKENAPNNIYLIGISQIVIDNLLA